VGTQTFLLCSEFSYTGISYIEVRLYCIGEIPEMLPRQTADFYFRGVLRAVASRRAASQERKASWIKGTNCISVLAFDRDLADPARSSCISRARKILETEASMQSSTTPGRGGGGTRKEQTSRPLAPAAQLDHRCLFFEAFSRSHLSIEGQATSQEKGRKTR
jgi:hypothetical protein